MSTGPQCQRVLKIRHPSRVFCMLNFQSSPRRLTNWIAEILALSAFLNSCKKRLSPIAMASNGYCVRSRKTGAPSVAFSNTYITFSRYLRRVDPTRLRLNCGARASPRNLEFGVIKKARCPSTPDNGKVGLESLPFVLHTVASKCLYRATQGRALVPDHP